MLSDNNQSRSIDEEIKWTVCLRIYVNESVKAIYNVLRLR